jgi:hypothetical protein
MNAISINTFLNVSTTIIAFLALMLSIYNFYLARKEKKPKLEIKVIDMYLNMEFQYQDYECDYLIKVVNKGERKITVNKLKFRIGNFLTFTDHYFTETYDNQKMPVKIEPGDEIFYSSFHKNLDHFFLRHNNKNEIILRAYAEDTVGNKYKSKRFKLYKQKNKYHSHCKRIVFLIFFII